MGEIQKVLNVLWNKEADRTLPYSLLEPTKIER